MTPRITLTSLRGGSIRGEMGIPGSPPIWGRTVTLGEKSSGKVGGHSDFVGAPPFRSPRFDKLCPIPWSATHGEFEARFVEECKAIALDWALAENGAQVVIPQGSEEDQDFIIQLAGILKRNPKRKKKVHSARIENYLRVNWKDHARLWEMTWDEVAAHINSFFKTRTKAATLKMRCYRRDLFLKREGGPRPRYDTESIL